jgi:S-DNA-T family DNA segregation ATPase FtsK/SpoIIIE
MSALGVRNLAGFNKKVTDAKKSGNPIMDPTWKPDPMLLEEEQCAPELEALPCVVVIVDELADMMMVVGKKVEELIARIAQKARAAGIHLILATQRPSVDVLTGLIKANIPTRMSFMVQSKVDSRTILGEGGAEQLLGNGDMLFLPPGGGIATRVHGAFVSDEEVHRVVADWKQRGKPVYIDSITQSVDDLDMGAMNNSGAGEDDESDALYDEAVSFVTETRKASISSVQRKLRIGYNRAARMIETMERTGVITEMGSNGSREVLTPPPPRD